MGERSFFVEPGAIQGDRVGLGGQIAHQIRRVLRLHPGDTVELLDGSGFVHVARISEISPEGVAAEVVERRRSDTEPRLQLELYQALLKGQKMELVLQKGTEIGVGRFVPVLSERCVSRPTAAEVERRLDRWRAIVREAAEQSGRAVLPGVASLESFEEACRSAAGADAAAMAWEEERAMGIRRVLREAGLSGPQDGGRGRRPRVALLVGPEGGFSPREAEEARNAGVRPASLGSRILRAETAALVAATLVFSETEDLGG